MQTFDSDGVEIAFLDEGDGEPVLLIHGFASNAETNWVYPQWIRTLTKAGRRVLAIDNRGHGRSEKLYDPDRYQAPLMAADAARLLDHLDIGTADVMGYSMGARISAFLALERPDIVRSVVFGGLGINMVRGVGGAEAIAAALEAPGGDDLGDEQARQFRKFAETTRSDLKALAACIRASRQKITQEEVGRIAAPTLVAVGETDAIAGDPHALADLLPDGEAFVIPGRDHMLAVGDRAFKARVVDFWSR